MIEIQVGHNELVLYRDTTLNIEYNNALFSQDAMEGDIVYSFDIPIRGNERTLNFEHLPYSVSHRKYDCTINVSGINIITGKLVVQKVTDKKYSVAVIVNPYPEGWKDRSIRDNESEEIIVSNDISVHRSSWQSFLKSTLNDNRIKFGPILNDEGYGDKNDDFGLYYGISHGKICNRVLFDQNDDVVASSNHPFVILFNASIPLDREEDGMYIERNQQCLMPQISLNHIISNIVKNMGYLFINRVESNSDLMPIYIQSPVALDASGIQFGNIPNWYFLFATRAANVTGYYGVAEQGYCNDNPQGLMWVRNSSQTEFRGVKFQASGWYHIRCEIKPTLTPIGEVYFKVAKWVSGNIPNSNPNNTSTNILIGSYNNNNETFVFDNMVYIDPSYVGVSLAIGFWLKTNFYGDESEIFVNGGEASLTIESKSIDQISYENIYRNRFHIAECFPNVTNADFLKYAIQSIGCALYIDMSSCLVELLPYRDVLKSKCIDLSEYVITKETNISYPEDKFRVYRLSSLSEKELNDSDLINPCNNIDELPSPYMNPGKLCYVKNMNSFVKAEKIQSEESNWKMDWVDQHFNIQDHTIGGIGEKDIVKSPFKVPGNSTSGDYINPIPSIPITISSKMFNTEDEPSSDIIMLYYRGLAKYGKSALRYQDMVPVSQAGFSLNAESGNTICDKYIREWQELISLSRTITYKLYIPLVKAIEITRLLKPQKSNPEDQTRWIMVNNVKSMPKKISFQIENNNGMVLCEIEAAKPD